VTPEEAKRLADEVASFNKIVAEKVEPSMKDSAEAKAAVAEVKVTVQKMEKWLSEVEQKADKARYSNPEGRYGVSDHLLAVIPERYKGCVEAYARRGDKNPVKMAAIESWLKDAIKVQVPKHAQKMGEDIGAIVERMNKVAQALGDDVHLKAAFAEGAGATGGFTVPTPLEAEVLRVMEDSAVCRPLCRKMTMTALTHQIPDDAGGVSVAVVAEAGTIAQSEPTFGQKNLTAKMIAARGLASLQVLQDSAIGLVQYWLERASEAYGLYEDAQILEGDGTGNNFSGLVAAAGVNAVVVGAGPTAAPSYAKLVEQAYAGSKRSTRRANAAWVMHPKILRKIVALEASGSPVLNRQDIARVLSENIVGPGFGEGTIVGYPVFTSDQILTNRTVGSSTDGSNIYFGPFQQGVIIGDLLGLTFDVSEHVAFNSAQLALRLLKRTAILVGTPGYMTKATGVASA
jgi:HK97 family phage major capsid protein